MTIRPGFFLVSAAVFVLDQLTKAALSSALAGGDTVQVIGNVLVFSAARNTGAAFGMFPGSRVPLILIGLIVLAAILYLHFRMPASDRLEQAALASIAGGTLGNLFDRAFRGYVFDFIKLPLWPAFNVADIFINVGIATLVYLFIFVRRDD